MKKLVAVVLAMIILMFSGCKNEIPPAAEANPPKETFEPEEQTEEPKEEWIFEPESEFPLFLKEIFEAGTEIYDQTEETIENITVLGDENEFFVTYEYIAREGEKKEFNDDCWLRIYGTRTDDGKYILNLRGGGYQGEMNLEESDITVGDVWPGREAGYDAALEEMIEKLEPMEILDTKYSYPQNIGEIFEIITGKDKSDLSRIEVFGGANEFFVRYVYSSETEDTAFLQIRVRVNNEGLYTIIAKGNGPFDYGLEKTDIKLEDIQ